MNKATYFVLNVLILLTIILGWGCSKGGGQKERSRLFADSTFTNPLLPSGADPWAIYHDGNYYYIKSHDRQIILMKTSDITELRNAEKDTIWKAPNGTNYSKGIWAPEIHYLNKKWYIYFAADDGHNRAHRMYVLENKARDPLDGQFILKGQLQTKPNDRWAIDGSVFKHKEALYFIWSGWPKSSSRTQNIYIAKMSNPWTISSARVLLSSPEYEWERKWKFEDTWVPDQPIYVNEGPNVIIHGGKIHLFYSASGCWTPYYALGRLTANIDSDFMDPSSWQKSKNPVFQQSREHGVYGTGHNSFFKSPDGTEDWILYHANDKPEFGCGGKRSPRAQRIHWTDNDMPVLGDAVSTSTALTKPSGTPPLK